MSTQEVCKVVSILGNKSPSDFQQTMHGTASSIVRNVRTPEFQLTKDLLHSSDTIRHIGKLHKVSCDHGTTEGIVQS